jgi:hypothetical protein
MYRASGTVGVLWWFGRRIGKRLHYVIIIEEREYRPLFYFICYG